MEARTLPLHRVDECLMLAHSVSTESKDCTKVGCVIVAPGSWQVLSSGHNEFCRGIDDTV